MKKIYISLFIVITIVLSVLLIGNTKVDAEEIGQDMYVYNVDGVDYYLQEKVGHHKSELDIQNKKIIVNVEDAVENPIQNVFRFYDEYGKEMSCYGRELDDEFFIYKSVGFSTVPIYFIGEFNLIRRCSNNVFFEFTYVIQDLEAPIFSGVKNLEYKVSEGVLSLDYIKSLIVVEDNDKSFDLYYLIKQNTFTGNEEKTGTYKIVFSAVDRAKNISEYTVFVNVENDVDNTDSTDNIDNADNTDSTDNIDNTSEKTNKNFIQENLIEVIIALALSIILLKIIFKKLF